MSHQKLTPREKRKVHIRKKIFGTSERPRLTVYRSNRYLYAQLIDDENQKTLAHASNLKDGKGSNIAAAAKVGQMIADRALQSKIQIVTFDRNGYKYHGVIKEIAESARKAGLQF